MKNNRIKRNLTSITHLETELAEESQNERRIPLVKRRRYKTSSDSSVATSKVNIEISPEYNSATLESASSTLNQPQLKMVSQSHMIKRSGKRKILQFDITKSQDIDSLEKHIRQKNLKFKYNREYNKSLRQNKLSIENINAIGDEFGVIAKENFKPGDRILGFYAGDLVGAGEENENSRYLFQLTDENGEIFANIDGENNGDWTAFVNFSPTPNLIATQEIIDGVVNICLKVATEILIGQQLLLDYGPFYKKNINHELLNLNSQDDSRSAEDLFFDSQLHTFYAAGVYSFDEKTCADFKLNTNQWLIPSLFIAILNNDLESLEKLLASGCPPDILAYACNSEEILNPFKQQHITPLMWASYLGKREKCIDLLIEYGAEINRCMLVNGYMAFTTLCKGYATPAEVDQIGKKLLEYMPHCYVIDKDELSLLHYAMLKNSSYLVSALLEIAKKENYNFYENMFDLESGGKKHADIDDCLLNNQFEILMILLNDMSERKLLEEIIKKNLIFKESVLTQLSKVTLQHLYHLLEKPEFKELRECVANVIKQNQTNEWPYPSAYEVELLNYLYSTNDNMEGIEILLENLNSYYLFQKCLTPTPNMPPFVSPLEYALLNQSAVAQHILAHMKNLLATLDQETAHKLLMFFDCYACIRLAVLNKKTDIYDAMMKLIKQYDKDGVICTKLLTQATANFNNSEKDSEISQKLFVDALNTYKLPMKRKTLTETLLNCYKPKNSNLSFIEKFKLLTASINSYTKPEVSSYNTPLIFEQENKFLSELMTILTQQPNTNTLNKPEIKEILESIIARRTVQVKLLLQHNKTSFSYLRELVNSINNSEKMLLLLEVKQSKQSMPFAQRLSFFSEFQTAIKSAPQLEEFYKQITNAI